jgi:hypothetical protein
LEISQNFVAFSEYMNFTVTHFKKMIQIQKGLTNMLQEYISRHFCIFSRYFRKLAHWDIRFHHCHPDSQQYHHT